MSYIKSVVTLSGGNVLVVFGHALSESPKPDILTQIRRVSNVGKKAAISHNQRKK